MRIPVNSHGTPSDLQGDCHTLDTWAMTCCSGSNQTDIVSQGGPDEIPTSIDIDLSPLTEADQSIQVKDIGLGKGITVLNDPEQLVVKIAARRLEVPEEVAAAEEAAEAEAEPEESAEEKEKQ